MNLFFWIFKLIFILLVFYFTFEKVKKTIPKSKKENEKRTFINVQEMSIFRNPKIVLKNTVFFTFDHTRHKYFLSFYNFVMINFFEFLQKL